MKLSLSNVPGRGLAVTRPGWPASDDLGKQPECVLCRLSKRVGRRLVDSGHPDATARPARPTRRAYNSLVSFHFGGTLTETPGGVAFAPGQRSDGHGLWSKSGRRTYHQKFIALLHL